MSLATQQALRHVQPGDIIFGIAEGGQEKLLIVHEVDEDGFWARHILSQTRIKFGRDGESRWAEGGGSCTVVSTAKLPPDMYAVALGLDRKFAARLYYPDSNLTKDEIQLVLNHDKFFRTRVLPGKEAIVRWAEKINGVRAILHLEWDPISGRDNPPDWNAYLGHLSELVDLLETPASTAEVRDFLNGMAANAGRTQQVGDRSDSVALSLVQLRESWS
jgi:hypothetical protein